jgi:hypothetical protein
MPDFVEEPLDQIAFFVDMLVAGMACDRDRVEGIIASAGAIAIGARKRSES